MGFQFINDEQKIRVSLSNRAYITMLEDMSVFDVSTQSAFINKLIDNYRDSSIASLTTYLDGIRDSFYSDIFSLEIDSNTKDNISNHFYLVQRKQALEILNSFMKEKNISKLYHISNSNIDFLKHDFEDEEIYKGKPGLYIKCLLEDYASLPFIKRERIFRKEIYEIVERACAEKHLLYVKIPIFNERKTIIIYPYKILPDTLNTQDYLTCYTRFKEESPSEKLSASFSMARLPMPNILKQSCFLSKNDIKSIEEDIQNLSVSFLRGESTEIHVKLSETGKRTYHNKIYSRPTKNVSLSSNDEYVFFCSENQAFNYFYSFGPDAEIISPKSLRDRMINSHINTLKKYTSDINN